MGFPEFMLSKEVVLELTLEQLRSFVKTNIFRDADVEVRNGRIYIVIPLEIMIPYEVKGDTITLKLPVTK